MKRIRIVALFVLVASIFGLMIGSAKTYVLNKVTKNAPIPVATAQTQPQPIVIGAFVVRGMPIRFIEAAAVNDKGASTLTYTIANIDGNAISGIDLALFDFNPAGKLMRVQAWDLRMDLKSGAAEKFSFQLKHRVTPGGRLILTADSIAGEVAGWKANFGEVAGAAAALVTGAQPVVAGVKTDQVPAESSGADFCTEAFGKAFRLSKSGDEKRLTSYACDRERRLVAFSFGAKSLSKS